MSGPLDMRGRVTIADGGATRTLNRVKGAITGVAAAGKTAGVNTQKVVSNTAKSVAVSGRKVGRTLSPTGGVGPGIVAGAFLKGAYDFDKQMQFISATLLPAGNDKLESHRKSMAALRAEIVRLAKIYPKTRSEIAKGAIEFVTAGNSADRTRKSIELLVQGAIASQSNVGKVGADVTDVVAAMFGAIKDDTLHRSRVLKTLNLMAVGATAANHTWGEQTLAMQYSAPVARALGIELERLVAMLGVLADNGFKGEKGGSALRTILLNLRAPTKKAQAAFRDLGIQIEKAFKFNDKAAFDPDRLMNRLKSGLGGLGPGVGQVVSETLGDKSLRGDLGVMRDILIRRLSSALNIGEDNVEARSKLAKMVDAHFNAAVEKFDENYLFEKLAKANPAQLKNITGVRRTPQAISLSKGFNDQYLPKLSRLRTEQTGALDRRMGEFLTSFSADVDRLVSSLDGFAESVERSGLLKDASGVFGGMRDFIQTIEKAEPGILRAGGGLVLLLGALSILGFAFAGLGTALAVILSPIGLLIGALGALAYSIYDYFGSLKAMKEFGAKKWDGFEGWWERRKKDWRELGLPTYKQPGGTGTGHGSGTAVDKSRIGKFAVPITGAAPGAAAGSAAAAVNTGRMSMKQAEGEARRSADQINQIMRKLNLTAEGRRIAESLAAGIRSGSPAVDKAVRDLTARAKQAAGNVNLNTGPSMRGATP